MLILRNAHVTELIPGVHIYKRIRIKDAEPVSHYE